MNEVGDIAFNTKKIAKFLSVYDSYQEKAVLLMEDHHTTASGEQWVIQVRMFRDMREL
tara:strand:- start:40 stop:213 length:174 start_codon:yes stop_codon:yes gene_type:complete